MVTKEVKVKSHTRKTKSGKSVIVRAHTSKHKCSGKDCKDCGSGGELLKKKFKEALPKIAYNPIYDHPDWEQIPQKPNQHHGGTGEKKWEKYYNGLKGALTKVTLPEAKERIKKEMKNARRMIGVYRANAALAESTGHNKAAEGFRAKAKKESAKLKSLKKK